MHCLAVRPLGIKNSLPNTLGIVSRPNHLPLQSHPRIPTVPIPFPGDLLQEPLHTICKKRGDQVEAGARFTPEAAHPRQFPGKPLVTPIIIKSEERTVLPKEHGGRTLQVATCRCLIPFQSRIHRRHRQTRGSLANQLHFRQADQHALRMAIQSNIGLFGEMGHHRHGEAQAAVKAIPA